VDSSIQRRSTQSGVDESNNFQRFLIEGLTPNEAKSLGAAERRSIAARGQRSSTMVDVPDRSRARSMQPTGQTSSQFPPTISITRPEHRTFLDHLSGLIWAFFAAYAFSIIIFLTKFCGIDLIFGFFLQMIVQTFAFAIYAFYKGYDLLGPVGHRIPMICRGLLIGIGVLTSFLAYYYITLPDLSAIRQSQVVLTIILSIFFLHERITITRIVACILTIIAIILLIRPTKFGAISPTIHNLTNHKTSWIPYTSSWNYIIGIGLALCTAITFSIASIMNKIYFSTQHLHNTVLCFWSALSALIISTILVFLTHFVIEDVRSFPHDWRLFVGIALALASIFVFIANQKAIKRERSSIVTLIYSTDIILALILQNSFTHIKSDTVVILGTNFIYY
jgi:drug/metabolite transporter (DMT)-like permease